MIPNLWDLESVQVVEHICVLGGWHISTAQGKKEAPVLGTLLDLTLYTSPPGCSSVSFITSLIHNKPGNK